MVTTLVAAPYLRLAELEPEVGLPDHPRLVWDTASGSCLLRPPGRGPASLYTLPAAARCSLVGWCWRRCLWAAA